MKNRKRKLLSTWQCYSYSMLSLTFLHPWLIKTLNHKTAYLYIVCIYQLFFIFSKYCVTNCQSNVSPVSAHLFQSIGKDLILTFFSVRSIMRKTGQSKLWRYEFEKQHFTLSNILLELAFLFSDCHQRTFLLA